MRDDSVIVIVEAEKSVLACTAWAERNGRDGFYFVAIGGCYGWRGVIGKKNGPKGERLDEKGPLPDLDVCRGHQVIVMLDSNAATNRDVRFARRELIIGG